MRKRITRRDKRNRTKKIIITSMLCLLFVMVAGYAAFQTNLNITAKGNIKKILGGEMLKRLCESTNKDGLYKDIYENEKCTYKGANPSNYIIFNNDIWRIISISTDNTIKIIRNEIVESRIWDTNDNNWTTSNINEYLNTEYLNSISTNKEKIVNGLYSIGSVNHQRDDIQYIINGENSKLWDGKVALPTVSEYLRANDNVEKCENVITNNSNNEICKETNWMYSIVPTDGYLWTLSANQTGGDNGLLPISYNNTIYNYHNNNVFGVSPCVYLSAKIELGGNGTKDNPYVIIN